MPAAKETGKSRTTHYLHEHAQEQCRKKYCTYQICSRRKRPAIFRRHCRSSEKLLPDKDKMKDRFRSFPTTQRKDPGRSRRYPTCNMPSNCFGINHSVSRSATERITIAGPNGSGKTSLLKLILGQLEPASGVISRALNKTTVCRPGYFMIDDQLKVYEQAALFNHSGLQEHEIKIQAHRVFVHAGVLG